MPKSTSHWSFLRYFPPLTRHSIFPPECIVSPSPLTVHKIFPREEAGDVTDNQLQALQPITAPSASSMILIRKPRGEVSRISRGGYNLQDTLGWSPLEYEEVRSFVIHLAKEHLNTRKPWSKQKVDDLKVVFSKAKERYPQLLQYDGNWVVTDFLKIYLKNCVGRA